LAGLLANVLTDVADALTLVWFRRPHPANARRNLTDEGLVDTAHANVRITLNGKFNALHRLDAHRVAVADVEHQRLAVHRRAVADAADLQPPGIALRDTDHHVIDQRASQAVQRPVPTLVIRARDENRAVLAHDADRLADRHLQLTLGPLDAHVLAVDGDIDTRRNGDGDDSDSRHDVLPGPQRGSVYFRRLENGAEQFAANTVAPRLGAAHHSLGCRQDRDAQAILDPRDLVVPDVHPQPRLGNPLELADRVLAVRGVLQVNRQRVVGLTLTHVVAGDVALTLQNLGDRDEHLRGRHRGALFARNARISNAAQHVIDWICRQTHGVLLAARARKPRAWSRATSSTWSPRAACHSARAPGNKSDTSRTCECRRAVDRSAYTGCAGGSRTSAVD